MRGALLGAFAIVSACSGTTSAVMLSNVYYPENGHGLGVVARQIGYGILGDMGFDVLREFWPEIAHKLKLPFRDEQRSKNSAAARQVFPHTAYR